MPQALKNGTKPARRDDLRPEWGILIPSLVVILCISIPAVLIPKEKEDFFKAIYNPLAFNFGTLYLWITVGLIVMCFYYALSRWGSIKFGSRDEKPEFSLVSWTAMIFCSAVGGAIMFWTITEPLWDILQPPQYAQSMSVEAYDWALAYLLMHWGPNAWCTYLITALPIAYMLYIRKEPFLRISMATEPIIGKGQANGFFGWGPANNYLDQNDSMAGTWGVGIQLRDMSFVDKITHTFRAAWWGGTNSPAMVKYMDSAYAWDSTSNHFEGPYMTTNDGMLEFNLVNVWQMYENFNINLELGYIANYMNGDTWRKSYPGWGNYSKQDAWKAQAIFTYKF